MYEYLEGRLVSRRPARVVLDVDGVGYDIAVPVGAEFHAARAAASGPAERVRVWTHLVVREDAHLLFGFSSEKQRELFRLLLSVRGVGPLLALAVLSTLSREQLLEAIAAEDLAALTRVRGVGRKTAEQILLDLRDKAPRCAESESDVLVPSPAARSPNFHDAVRALVSIGYPDKQAKDSVERAAKRVAEDDLELLVRTALQP